MRRRPESESHAISASGRQDNKLSPRYSKEGSHESFLRVLNEALAADHDAQLRDLPETFPTIHVAGLPRSGTTLVYQLVASYMDVGFINNLSAAFWRAPIFGIKLSRHLLPGTFSSSFRSEFGRTTGISEPHEFGYFWAAELGYIDPLERAVEDADPVDWSRLKTLIVNMAGEFQAPMLFKTLYVMWHAGDFYRTLPHSYFVNVRRSIDEIALSLLMTRRKFGGSEDQWVSLKPRDYLLLQALDPWTQVTAQAVLFEQSLDQQLSGVPASNVLKIDYETVCDSPRSLLQGLGERLSSAGHKVDILIDEVIPSTPRSRPECTEDDRRRVADALERIAEEGLDVLLGKVS